MCPFEKVTAVWQLGSDDLVEIGPETVVGCRQTSWDEWGPDHIGFVEDDFVSMGKGCSISRCVRYNTLKGTENDKPQRCPLVDSVYKLRDPQDGFV